MSVSRDDEDFSRWVKNWQSEIQAPVDRLTASIKLSPQTKAVLALMRHLRAAEADPEIKSCAQIHDVIGQIIKEIGGKEIRKARTGIGLAAAFSKPKAKSTNTENAKAPRKKDEKKYAEERFLAWAKNTKLYANQSKYIEAVIDGLKTTHKPDEKTIRSWFKEFLSQARAADTLSELAKTKFQKFK